MSKGHSVKTIAHYARDKRIGYAVVRKLRAAGYETTLCMCHDIQGQRLHAVTLTYKGWPVLVRSVGSADSYRDTAFKLANPHAYYEQRGASDIQELCAWLEARIDRSYPQS